MEEPENVAYDGSYHQEQLHIADIPCCAISSRWKDLAMPSPSTGAEAAADLPDGGNITITVNNNEVELGNSSNDDDDSSSSCDDDISDAASGSDGGSPRADVACDLTALSLVDDCDADLPLQPIPDEYEGWHFFL